MVLSIRQKLDIQLEGVDHLFAECSLNHCVTICQVESQDFPCVHLTKVNLGLQRCGYSLQPHAAHGLRDAKMESECP